MCDDFNSVTELRYSELKGGIEDGGQIDTNNEKSKILMHDRTRYVDTSLFVTQ